MEDAKTPLPLYAPCNVGDTFYCVGQIAPNEPPYFESYTVAAVMFDGKKWYVTDDIGCFYEIGSDNALLDESAALTRFRELREEWLKNSGGTKWQRNL